MTPTQQTKIAELLVDKLAAHHNQTTDPTLPPSIRLNNIKQKMPLAKVLYDMMREAYTNGWQDGFRNGICRGDGNYSKPNRAEYALEDFEHFLNNIK